MTADGLEPEAERPDPPVLTRWTGAAIGLGLAIVGITLDELGLGRVEWAVALALGTGIAIWIRWAKHRSRWFWPAVGSLIAASAAICVFVDWPFNPGETGKGWFTMIAACAIAETAWLFWMGWLFEPRDAPRTRQQIVTEVILYCFAILVVALIGFLIWVVGHAEAENKRLAQVVMTEKSDRSAIRLMACLDPTRKGRSYWSDMPGVAGGKSLYDVNRSDGINVIDQGDVRVVQVMTKRGRPLRKDEIARVEACLAPQP